MGPKDAIIVAVAVVLPLVPLVFTALVTEPEDAYAEGPAGEPAQPGQPLQGPPPVEQLPDPGPASERDLLASYGMTVGTLVRELGEIAEGLEGDPQVRGHWEQLRVDHGLADTDAAYGEFVRVRLAHEAFRAGGWAGLTWGVTDAEPDSTRIWRAWLDGEGPEVVAECDELSALFAFVARGMGVEHVGLFWPTWNHTVAVWTTEGQAGEDVRIVVPTSQIFLDPVAGLGDRTFDPWTQRTIYDYGAQDLPPGTLLPDAVVKRIIEGARLHGGGSAEELTLRRVRGGWFRR